MLRDLKIWRPVSMQTLKSLALLGALALAFPAQAAPVSLTNAGFENSWTSTTHVGSDGHVTFNYQPSGPNMGWSFGSATGVSSSYDLLSAYEGSRFAFLQVATAPLSQGFALDSAAAVTLDFALALRPNYRPGQTVQVSVDGQQAGLFDAASSIWSVKTLSLGHLAAGNHTLSFAGMAPYAVYGDTTAFIDAVHLNAAPVPEPETYAMLLAGLGLLGGIVRRRKQPQ